MTWSSFWRSIGKDIECLTTGTVHFATHVVDDGFSTVRAFGDDVVKVSHEASGAVSNVGSSLAFPRAIGAAEMMLLKR